MGQKKYKTKNMELFSICGGVQSQRSTKLGTVIDKVYTMLAP